MININNGVENEFILYLGSEISLTDPYFIFEFIDNYGRVDIKTLTDTSTANSYNKFSFIEGTDIKLQSSGTFNVYESLTDTDNLDECTLIYDSLYKFIQDKRKSYTYDPFISKENYVYQPTYTAPYSTTDGVLQTTVGDFAVTDGNYKINL